MDDVNPLAGLPKQDYDRLAEDLEFAAWVVGNLVVRFFDPIPARLLEVLHLEELTVGPIASYLRPLPGEQYQHRGAVADVYGGNRVLGITPLADGLLTVYSDDKGPYADQRIPGMDWIAYTGDGLSGHQTLSSGNRAMAKYQERRKALRYWHKPHRGRWTFETWTVIVQRRRRWGCGQDGLQRREFVWILAPVPSPISDTWPREVIEALNQDDGQLHDDSIDVIPAEVALPPKSERISARQRYEQLTAAAHRTASGRTRSSKLVQMERYLRSPAAREAVILRSNGHCENPSCMGHPLDRTDSGAPLLEVDHVNGLARTGQDVPELMIALCPNCHALKTRGRERSALQRDLLVVARARHQDFLERQ
ncbi:HNH endonuclease signature motif containing protein [Streptomyces sp. V3I8]|uniref:HNH endonuclease signature motif containing protein n=1 Tax=Streptomyces sp. V3I8 TaxID=3042279 RepID=UPI0027D82F5E|nr:HNH endonuclease signature motif containing protein [Streptomyces sp. V3I8]